MNIYLYIIRGIAFYQAQKNVLPAGAIWTSFKELMKGTCLHHCMRLPSTIPFELYHPEQEAFFDNNLSNAIENPYKHKAISYAIANL